jgi:hypothetical protein
MLGKVNENNNQREAVNHSFFEDDYGVLNRLVKA